MLDPIIEANIAKELEGCWLWLAWHNRWGYGQVKYHGKTWTSARLVYTQDRGPIPDRMTLDHLCRNTICVNPAHLEPVTMRENIMRGRSFSAINAAKTHCRNGHPLVSGNLHKSSSGRRICATCNRFYVSRYKSSKRGAR